MHILIPIVTNFMFGFLASHFAQKRGRDGTTWFIIGFVLNIFGLALLFLLPPVASQERVGPRGPVMNAQSQDPFSWSSGGSSSASSEAEDTEAQAPPLSQLDMFRQQDWYYMNREHKQEGPIAYEDLRLAFNSERAHEDTFIWSEGMPEWMKLRDLSVILSDFQS
jgi:hypothetical protein